MSNSTANSPVTTPGTASSKDLPNSHSRTCWLNGAFVREEDARISIFDRAVLFGDGVYEVAAALNGCLLDADLHLARLERSRRAIGIETSRSVSDISDVMQSLLDRNGITDGLVYLELTRGVAERDFVFPSDAEPTIFSYARPKRYRDDPNTAGIHLKTVADIRWARRDIKSTAMLAQVLAKQEARSAGAFEALMHENGEVTEGGSSNIWIVRGGILVTRPLSEKLLAGITRAVTIDLARELNLPVEERVFTVEEALDADECFITSATSFVLPATQIDGANVKDGKPGAVTMELRQAYIHRADRLTGRS